MAGAVLQIDWLVPPLFFTIKLNKMKSIITIILIIGSFTCAAQQRATLDTTLAGRIFLKDTKTNIVYEVFKDGKKSYIIKDGKRMNIYRREPPSTKPAAEFSTTKN